MDKGAELYRNFIDELVNMSKSCVDANNVKKGNVPGVEAQQIGINGILAKLSDKDRKKLSEFVLDVYSSGIFDVLDYLEWLRVSKNMEMKIDDQTLPMGKYEGIQNDYIGRRQDWEWYE